jgi:nucleoside phosphorylase
LLSFFLARAVCTYYGSDWMRHPWTKENIHFMFERRGSVSGVFLNEPFVSAYFRPSSLAANQASNLLSFSEIYALGIILLELELGSTIEKEMLDFPECFAPDRSPVIDADLYTAIKLHEDLYRMEDTHRLLYEVIGICLRPTVLKPYATEMTGFRHAIHKYIVSPLQELIAGSYVEDDPEKVRVSRPTVELDTSLASRGVLSPRHISRSTSPGANQTFPPYPQNPSPAKISRHDSLDNLSSSLSRFSSLCLETEVVNYTHSDYTVGWICALPIEMAACTAMLDKLHPSLHIGSQDNNNYSLGKIGTHNVVIACLPSGVYGTTSAATVAMDMMYSFPSIRHRFMVGIGGGIPSKKNDIRLGDVVVSKPSNTTSGVFQHDMGKILHGSHTKFIGTLNKPPHPLLTAISTLQSRHFLTKSKVCSYLDDMKSRLGSSWCNFMPPNRTTDRLFRSDFAHDESNDTCSKCAATEEQTRPIRSSDHPQIYYGPIVSGNSVVRDSYTRDRLGEQGFLAFEMEAAGLMDRFPCLVIRGICDYSDSHKNKEWQGYAAAAAAAFAKEVLSVIHES